MVIDFVQLLKDFGIPYRLDTEGWVNISCPICLHEGTRGFKGGFNLVGGYYHCWACGGHRIGEVISVLLRKTRLQVDELLTKYSGSLSIQASINKRRPTAQSVSLPGGELETRHRKYLKGRGFDPDYLIDKYHILGTGLTGDWAFRIIIPIYLNGRVVSFQGRDITGKQELRYKTLSIEKSIVNPKHIIYNIDNCKGNTIVLVEGVFDCWKLGDGVGATLGTSMSEEQINFIIRRYNKAILLFDNEEEAQNRAATYGSLLSKMIEVELYNPEFIHDPGSYTEEETKEVRKELGL